MTTQSAAAMQPFSILSFLPNKQGTTDSGFRPHSIMRTSDKEIFAIGHTVTNGTQMRGEILRFELLEDSVFVITTWSGIGMDLDSLTKIILLPSQHQIGDNVWLNLWSSNIVSEVIAVHFYSGKVKYDLKVFGGNGEETRIYNIDFIFVLSKVI